MTKLILLRRKAIWRRLLLSCALISSQVALAETIMVRHGEGISHGFLVLRSLDGKTLATGDQVQVVSGDRVTTEIIFHFKDGSLHDETTVFTQDHVFHLVSDHLIQKGPSFPHPIDILIDASKNQVLIKAAAGDKTKEEDGSHAGRAKPIDLPKDIANGMILSLLRNISPETPETKVSMLTTLSKPRLVKLAISAKGERTFSVAGSSRKATDYVIKVEIGGVAGVVAPLLGKEPPDTHIWMSTGESPTFVRSEGPLYEGGPIWRIDLASLHLSDQDLNTGLGSKPPDNKKK